MKNNLFEAWWSLIGRFLRSLVMRLLRTGALVDCVVDMALTGLSLHRDDRRPMRHFQTCLADIGSKLAAIAVRSPKHLGDRPLPSFNRSQTATCGSPTYVPRKSHARSQPRGAASGTDRSAASPWALWRHE